jgi:hypothetical protein
MGQKLMGQSENFPTQQYLALTLIYVENKEILTILRIYVQRELTWHLSMSPASKTSHLIQGERFTGFTSP